jgi:hypothetical protein
VVVGHQKSLPVSTVSESSTIIEGRAKPVRPAGGLESAKRASDKMRAKKERGTRRPREMSHAGEGRERPGGGRVLKASRTLSSHHAPPPIKTS